MKCVICNGSDIKVRTVDEQIALGDDIVLVRLTLPVCSQCGERYYDRKAIQLVERVRAKVKQRLLDVEDVGKVFRVREHNLSVSHAL
ncbi:MAG: YgiT-type zinc finger protein [Deltaproteobacteria bacterium]|nr:YgiT-type zinc finger protein [Deltaproteobacteria bacterium]MBW2662079.1 YgiT-type zinc finger protein [Deltaproteobacteria bacterium]